MFTKKAKSIQEQITLLQERGLHISKPKVTEKYLQNISYYRLGEYWYVMQSDKENHIFKPNNSFEVVIALYNFEDYKRIL